MRAGGVLGVVLAVGLLTGCGANGPRPPMTPAEAPEHYGEILADVRDVVDEEAGARAWASVERDLVAWDASQGRCPHRIPGWRAEEPIRVDAWARILEALEPVLIEHGFHDLHENESHTGEWAFLSAEDDHGAVLYLRSTGHIELGVTGGSVLRGPTSCPSDSGP